jgi:small subunit ribosomal protein S2
MPEVTMRDLLEAGVHFGHQTNRWNPKMRRYIFGDKNGIHIIDLSQTIRMFTRAMEFVTETTARGKSVLLVGTKRQAQESVRSEAVRAGQYYCVNRWLGGTLTNFNTIRKSIDKLKGLEKTLTDSSSKYTKKEVLGFERDRDRLENNVGGIRDLNGLPGAVFVLDPKKELLAIREANKLHIPVIAICDTNCDPDGIDFIIPGNDDAIRAIRLYTSSVADACLEGAQLASARLEESARDAARDAADYHAPSGQSGGAGPEIVVRNKRETASEETT